MIWMPEGQRRPTTSQMTVISIDLYLLVINFLVKGILVFIIYLWVLVFIVRLWVLMNLLIGFLFEILYLYASVNFEAF